MIKDCLNLPLLEQICYTKRMKNVHRIRVETNKVIQFKAKKFFPKMLIAFEDLSIFFRIKQDNNLIRNFFLGLGTGSSSTAYKQAPN